MLKYLLPIIISMALFSCERSVSFEELDMEFASTPNVYALARKDSIQFSAILVMPINQAGLSTMLRITGVNLYKGNVKQQATLIERQSIDVLSNMLQYFYVLKSPLITEGHEYSLEFLIEGYEPIVTSATLHEPRAIELSSIVQIPSDEYETRYELLFAVDDPPNEDNYYQFYIWGQLHEYSQPVQYTYEGFKNAGVQQPFYFSDRFLQNNQFSIQLIESTIEPPEMVYYQLVQVDSANYLSAQAAEKQQSMQESDAFYAFEPINAYSNVQNALGTFVTFSQPYVDSINMYELFPR